MISSADAQPTKIILIGTGELGYAEIEIDRSIHLVGDNNAGKTTLINALQFLYINDFRKLDFGDYENRESMRFYFKNGDRAYILFEILTPTGYFVFGLHGTGLQHGHSPDRFLYSGRYNQSVFLPDGKTVRPIGEVAPDLAQKDFRKLSIADHKGVLTGLGRSDLPSLSLVPVSDISDYDHFVTVFKHLIHLHRVDVVELKSLMEAINHRNMNGTKGLDLNASYQRQYDEVTRLDKSIEETSKLAPLVAEVRRLEKIRVTFIDRLPSLHASIKQSLIHQEDHLLAEIEKRSDENHAFGGDNEAGEVILGQFESKQNSQSAEKGKVDARVDAIENDKIRFDGFVVEIEEQSLINQQSDLRALQRRQIHAEKKPAELKKELENNRRHQEEVKGFSRSTLNKLRQILPDTSVVRLSHLVNHRVLLSPFDESEGVFAKSEEGFDQLIADLCKNLTDEYYEGEVVTIALPMGEGIDLSPYSSASNIEERLAQLKEEQSLLEQSLKDAQEAVKVQREIENAEKAVLKMKRDLEDYGLFVANLNDLPDLLRSRENLEGLISEILEKKKALRREIDTRKEAINTNNSTIEKYRRRNSENTRRFSELETLTATREAGLIDVADIPLTDLFVQYEEEFNQYRVSENQYLVARNLLADNDLLREVPLDSVIDRANEYMEAMDGLVVRRDNLWGGLLTEIRRDCRDLLENLKVVESFTSRLTSELNRKSISNLQRVDAKIDENKALVDQINIFVKEVDLFAPETKDQDRAKDYLRDFLRHRTTIDLGDLYSLSFEVTKASGTKVTYSDSNIESRGTSLTVKVLVNVYMLNTLLKNRKGNTIIPFYVDEFGTLGLKNQKSIIDMAARLNCVPIVASPSSSNVTDRVYTLASGQGQAWVDHRNKYERVYEVPE